jgi:lysozyme family protein
MKNDSKFALKRFFIYVAFNIEGEGYDSNDPGGETIYGITKKWHAESYKKLKEAIESKDKTKIESAIYEAYYPIFKESYAEMIFPHYPTLAKTHFDFYFNAGKHAFETLQKVLNHWGYYNSAIDGIFGPHSQEALKRLIDDKVYDTSDLLLYSIYNYFRREFYLHNPQKRYIIGWLNRVQKIDKICLGFELED